MEYNKFSELFAENSVLLWFSPGRGCLVVCETENPKYSPYLNIINISEYYQNIWVLSTISEYHQNIWVLSKYLSIINNIWISLRYLSIIKIYEFYQQYMKIIKLSEYYQKILSFRISNYVSYTEIGQNTKKSISPKNTN